MNFYRRSALTADVQATLDRYDAEVRAIVGPSIRTPLRMRDWELAKILEALDGLVPGARVLDIGSFNTYLAAWLARRGASVVASDLLFQRLTKNLLRRVRLAPRKPTEAFYFDWTRALRRAGAQVSSLNATHLACPDASFDIVIALSVVEHIPAIERAIAELFRVLKPGGRLLLTTDCSPEPVPYANGVRYFSHSELEALFRSYPITSSSDAPDFARENWCYDLGRPVVTAFVELTKPVAMPIVR